MVEYTINPETGRAIQVGGDTFNRLIWHRYDYINNELVQRENPPPAPQYFFNPITGRRIRAGSRRYHEYIRAGWEILDGYYLAPPAEDIDITEVIAMVQEAGSRQRSANPTTYEEVMAVHGEGLANLNVSLCQECLYPLKPTDGRYCADCKP